MKRVIVGAFAVAVLASTGAFAGGELKSGPQVGQKGAIKPFNPLHATGPGEGGKACIVWAAGAKPVAMIFAREVSDPLTSLVKKIDAENAKQGKKMVSFVVFLNDKEGLKDELKQLAAKENIKHTIFSIESPAGPAGYTVPKEADVTVVLYVNRDIKANHAFRKGEFDAKDIEPILADIPKILKK